MLFLCLTLIAADGSIPEAFPLRQAATESDTSLSRFGCGAGGAEAPLLPVPLVQVAEPQLWGWLSMV